MGNDITTAVALKEFQKTGAKEVFDKDKVVIVLDHFTPNKDIKAAEQCKSIRTFAYDMEVKNFFDVGQMGIEHALLPEKRDCCSRSGYHRRGFPYLYLRRIGCVLHGHRQHRYGNRHGNRRSMVQGAQCHQIRADRQACKNGSAARISFCTSLA